MDLFKEIFTAPLEYWYITVPQIIYMIAAGIAFIGPLAWVPCVAYLLAFTISPKTAMLAAGAVMAAHGAIWFLKGFIGDRLAARKKADEDEEYKGVPKLKE